MAKRSINNSHDLNEVFGRLDKLTAETRASWGKMNIRQMLRHVGDAANFAFDSPNPNAKKKSFMKWMIFNIPAPKNAKTLPEIDQVAKGVDPDDFERERSRVKELFEKISSSNGPFKVNPFLGELTKDEWGKLCYVHANHHLKQFGV